MHDSDENFGNFRAIQKQHIENIEQCWEMTFFLFDQWGVSAAYQQSDDWNILDTLADGLNVSKTFGASTSRGSEWRIVLINEWTFYEERGRWKKLEHK